MKKSLLIIMNIIMAISMSACSLNISLDTNRDDATPTETIPQKVYVEKEEPVVESNTTRNVEQPFYGVWCGGSKNKSDMDKIASQLSERGFDSRVVNTQDWSNLNAEKYYVVTAGVCAHEEDAQLLLEQVKSYGYSNAYIKYTGAHR